MGAAVLFFFVCFCFMVSLRNVMETKPTHILYTSAPHAWAQDWRPACAQRKRDRKAPKTQNVTVSQVCVVFVRKVREGKHTGTFQSCEICGMWSVRWREGGRMSGREVKGSRSGASEAVRCLVLLVRSQESWHFAAYEPNEGAGKHLVGLPSGVLEVVAWVSQHIKQSLNQFFILRERDTDGCKTSYLTTYFSA